VIKFNEATREDGSFTWLMSKYQCMHCVDAGCLEACPAPGAIFRRENGIVDFDHDKCIGCGYCITGCPFDVPRLSPVTQKVYKCTLCSDRTSVGLEPACIKACPTNCLTFGARDDLVRLADARAEALRSEGRENAGVYNPAGVGGTNVLYVLEDATRPEAYGLPRDPTIPWQVRLWKGPIKWIGNAVLVGGIVGAFLHYLRYGPKEVRE
jgi:formate dehydrogenase beta subunit